MFIFLDSKDLIDLLENDSPVSAEELGDTFRKSKARLVISFQVVAELAAPLTRLHASTNVMSLLCRLEELPLSFIGEVKIQRLELQEACDAFTERREYSPVDPYVPRFDYTIQDPPPTAGYLKRTIAETIWDIWKTTPQVLGGFGHYRSTYRQLLAGDRSLSKPPSLPDFFPVVFRRAIEAYGIGTNGVDSEALARWIFACPDRCPAMRIGFEIWHRLRVNATDAAKDSDLSDFVHLFNLPYVDAFTLDRRMLSYIGQVQPAARTLGVGFRNSRDLLNYFSPSTTPSRDIR